MRCLTNSIRASTYIPKRDSRLIRRSLDGFDGSLVFIKTAVTEEANIETGANRIYRNQGNFSDRCSATLECSDECRTTVDGSEGGSRAWALHGSNLSI